MARKIKGPGKGQDAGDAGSHANGGSGESPNRLDEVAGSDSDPQDDGISAGATDTDEDDEVGYKKPPKRTQFQPGQSGNPRGRQKGSRGLKTDLAAELATTYTTMINRQAVKGTKQRLALKALTTRAAHGDVKSIALLISMTMQVLGPEDRGSGKVALSSRDQALLDQLLSDDVEDDEQDVTGPEPEADCAGGADGNSGGRSPPVADSDDIPDDEEPSNA